MKIDLIFAAGGKGRRDFHGKTVVVIDVLRATSTIVTALTNGCLALYPVADPGTAALFRRKLGSDCLTGGERQGLKISGFGLGNSPLEYTAETVAGQRIILTTSNGTQALLEAEHAAEILIGSFLNAGRTSSYLADKAEVVFLCRNQWRTALKICSVPVDDRTALASGVRRVDRCCPDWFV